ncbi:hypothetical protein [Chlorogloeopsis fritschii]|uniref:hypothetical protein n=1 Tax=Chlorogloeopsis fritschii TaxID=1124 RepID=UPI00370DBA13
MGDYWDEQIDSGSKILQWIWDGNNWLSRDILQRSAGVMTSGQNILVGGVIGLLSSNSEDIPIDTGNVRSIYLVSLSCGFKVNSGNLSTSHYWRLNFKSGASVVQSLDIKVGDNNETTGNVRKTSSAINIVYAHNGRYNLSLTKHGNPPDIISPTSMVEYRLVR